ncbi:MAG: ATP synthase F1 subunit delta [Acidobacteria bacterium OLB17]|nr:MAG: ATP synthase F1 subunit delta [Acidobacteria bacterium OLB17]MCZ2390896.1 ATP synthase F1 subunit delta [Acidobacteriota bacterium]
MSTETIARRYAIALADVVTKNGEAAGVKGELNAWNEMVASSPDLQSVFANPSIQHSAKEKLLETLIAKAGPSKTTANFLRVLVKNDRIGDLPQIQERFEEELAERSGVVVASVVSARDLPESEKGVFQANLEKLTGRKVEIEYGVDPEIIGGVVTRIGSTVYDSSVRTKLDNLREELAAA